VGLLLCVGILFALFLKFRHNAFIVALLLAYTASNLLSNGIMFRPLPGFMFALCLIAAIAAHEMLLRDQWVSAVKWRQAAGVPFFQHPPQAGI
jgi:hypothetical protein